MTIEIKNTDVNEMYCAMRSITKKIKNLKTKKDLAQFEFSIRKQIHENYIHDSLDDSAMAEMYLILGTICEFAMRGINNAKA